MKLGREGIGGRRSNVKMLSKQCHAKGNNKKKHSVETESKEKTKKAV